MIPQTGTHERSGDGFPEQALELTPLRPSFDCERYDGNEEEGSRVTTDRKMQNSWREQLPCIVVGLTNAAAILAAGALVYYGITSTGDNLIVEASNLQHWGDRKIEQILNEANGISNRFIDQANSTAQAFVRTLAPAIHQAVRNGVEEALRNYFG